MISLDASFASGHGPAMNGASGGTLSSARHEPSYDMPSCRRCSAPATFLKSEHWIARNERGDPSARRLLVTTPISIRQPRRR
jgi:hypothetical protein